jgi:hypothetical protein
MNWQWVTCWLMWPGWWGEKKEIQKKVWTQKSWPLLCGLYSTFILYVQQLCLQLQVVLVCHDLVVSNKKCRGPTYEHFFFYCYASFHSFISCLCHSSIVEATDRVAASHCCSYKQVLCFKIHPYHHFFLLI